jgi:hypothetical protein
MSIQHQRVLELCNELRLGGVAAACTRSSSCCCSNS